MLPFSASFNISFFHSFFLSDFKNNHEPPRVSGPCILYKPIIEPWRLVEVNWRTLQSDVTHRAIPCQTDWVWSERERISNSCRSTPENWTQIHWICKGLTTPLAKKNKNNSSRCYWHVVTVGGDNTNERFTKDLWTLSIDLNNKKELTRKQDFRFFRGVLDIVVFRYVQPRTFKTWWKIQLHYANEILRLPRTCGITRSLAVTTNPIVGHGWRHLRYCHSDQKRTKMRNHHRYLHRVLPYWDRWKWDFLGEWRDRQARDWVDQFEHPKFPAIIPDRVCLLRGRMREEEKCGMTSDELQSTG